MGIRDGDRHFLNPKPEVASPVVDVIFELVPIEPLLIDVAFRVREEV
jgi:hypothetical protein